MYICTVLVMQWWLHITLQQGGEFTKDTIIICIGIFVPGKKM